MGCCLGVVHLVEDQELRPLLDLLELPAFRLLVLLQLALAQGHHLLSLASLQLVR